MRVSTATCAASEQLIRFDTLADGSHKTSTGVHTPIEEVPESPDSHANPLQGFHTFAALGTAPYPGRYDVADFPPRGHRRLPTIGSGLPMSEVPTEQQIQELEDQEPARRMTTTT